MIKRSKITATIESILRTLPSVTILGPRQCGKTTLAREIAKKNSESVFFDLERPVDRQRLENPESVLMNQKGLVVIDEAQNDPNLFESLRYILDQSSSSLELILTGSASPALIKNVSESLAGRTATLDLSGFSLEEVDSENWRSLWERGGFPRSFLSENRKASLLWRESFVRTFLERDIPQFGITIPAETLRRFWTMIAHYHGQIWNGSEFARSLGATEPTARKYLDILAGSFMVRVLPPWHENLKKRQVKSPKIYIRDSGILHSLLGVKDEHELLGHPKLGASWEGFAIEQVMTILDSRDVYFWSTHSGAELDLLFLRGNKRYGFEFKFSDAPKVTKSMKIALEDLGLHELWVIYPGNENFQLEERIQAVSIQSLTQKLNALIE